MTTRMQNIALPLVQLITNHKSAPEGLNRTLLRRYHAMKYMKDLKKALSHHIGVLEESMAQYVECQDRIRHIKTLNWK